MRLGIISDIHSNLPALECVLKELETQDVDKILHAGDVVGYNPYPNEVIEVIRNAEIISILGNHDRAVNSVDTAGFNPYAAQAVYWTVDVLKKESASYLKKLKPREVLKFDEKTIVAVHGSPWNDDEYVYEQELTARFLEEANADILIYGHTHVPCVKRFSTGIVINPGSVGQPRDANPKASYAVLDLEKGHAEIKRVGYNVKAVVEDIEKAGLPLFLAQRLILGI